MSCLNPSPNKRKHYEPLESPGKRKKAPVLSEKDNFYRACKQVSSKKFFDYQERFLLLYLPSCVQTSCNHTRKSDTIVQMPYFAQNSFTSNITNTTWYQALEVCRMCLTPTQYLASNILQEIVEIIMNVHEDEVSEYAPKYIIESCQQILLQNFSTHPPCLNKDLRECYAKFLTSSMPPKENTHTDRHQHEHNKGIVKYCMNRLEYELSANSLDEPLVKKYTPEDLKHQVQGVHWQKNKFDIYESLHRQQRIERLFVVLETIIELLQFDLAIDLSRLSKNHSLGLRSSKLMQIVLEIQPKSRKITRNCLQIFRIFAHVIHLKYPEAMVKTITAWLNTTMQAIYILQPDSNTNYPHLTDTYAGVGQAMYEIIVDMPQDSIIRILQAIQPTYMRHVVGMFYINKILSANSGCIFQTLKTFLTEPHWHLYISDNTKLKCLDKLPTQKINDKIDYLMNVFTMPLENSVNSPYAKMQLDWKVKNVKVSLNHIVHSLYLTLDAYLEATDLQSVRDTWYNLNMQMSDKDSSSEKSGYNITPELKNKYERDLYYLQELSHLFSDLKKRRKLPQEFKIFQNIKLLKLRL